MKTRANTYRTGVTRHAHRAAWHGAAIIFCFLQTQAAHGQSFTPPNPYSDIRIDQNLGAQVPLDMELTDETGKQVRLRDYFGQKPVVLILAYYECPMLCTEVLRGALDSFNALTFDIGKDFTVLTVSINPNETSELAAAKKKMHVDAYQRPGAAEGWRFFTGKEEAVRKLADTVGFQYVYDAGTKQYAHASGIIVLTPVGKVSRYFMGIDYYARDLRLALVEASANKIGTLADKLTLLCFHYDPATGKYGLYIMGLLRLLSVATLAVLGAFMLVMFIRDYRMKAVRVHNVVPLQ